jgi:hypothetical protein
VTAGRKAYSLTHGSYLQFSFFNLSQRDTISFACQVEPDHFHSPKRGSILVVCAWVKSAALPAGDFYMNRVVASPLVVAPTSLIR